MSGIFISYRREDTAPYARLLSDALAARFGRGRIYRDLDSMAPGDDFPRAIAQAIATCDVLLALIGPAWLARRPDGTLRLDDPSDYVRIEITAGLARDVLIVPVLVEDTPMPRRAELPEAVAGLCDRQAHRLSDEGWAGGVERLADALEPVVGGRRRQRSARTVRTSATALAAAVVIVVGVLLARAWSAGDPKIRANEFRPIACAFGDVAIAVRSGSRLDKAVTFDVVIRSESAGVVIPKLPHVSVLRGEVLLPTTPEFSSWPLSPTALAAGTPFEGRVAATDVGGGLPDRGSTVRVRVDLVDVEGPACSLPSYEVTVP